MTVVDELEVTEAELTEALRISEAVTFAPNRGRSAVAADDTVQLHLMRPCVGKGRGRHVYEADMLKRHAESGHFDNWKMYIDHISPEATKKAGGLPRSMRDLGGRILETKWDPNVPASGRFGAGAVVATAKPVKWVRELIADDPELVDVSLNTFATGVRPTKADGVPAFIVEGFVQDGSADWVTKAGAGGKVVQILEAEMSSGGLGYVDDDDLRAAMDTRSDTELAALMRSSRPAVAEALTTAPTGGQEEDDMTPEEVQEAVQTALRSDAGQTLITEVVEAIATEVVQETLKTVLPAAIGRGAEVIETQLHESVTAQVKAQLRASKLSERAAAVIEAAKLPEKFEADALARVAVMESVIDDVDDTGAVTKSAEDKAVEIAEAAIANANDMISSINPAAKTTRTIVTDNGGGTAADTEEHGEQVTESEVAIAHSTHELAQAGIDLSAYGVKPVEKQPVTA